MNVLVIGGTRFVGHFLVWRLLAAGHRVTLFHRGVTPDDFGARVERIHGDRTGPDLARLLGGRKFDACVDFAAYLPEDAQGAVDVLSGNVGHYVFISTGQVYLVREGCPRPAREADYDGPVMPRPQEPVEQNEWDYGVGKRGCEDVLARAHATAGFPYTSLRIPMVNGERDHFRRVEGYLWRLLDGGPLLLPDGGEEKCRHVYGRDVARAVVALLGNARTFGQAYNLCSEEILTTREVLSELARIAGVSPRFVTLPSGELRERGILPKEISPFSQKWMSLLDPEKAKHELGFVATPLLTQLECIVASALAHFPPRPPEGYRHRGLELELAAKHGG
ncbi:MAG TPA: NAD-dependent epimerase/dehydratase family protein [Myxococcaceae bacterium]|nr:NAD-dependent epimerase/dehydratase family protein [Myxococcaceae bacterium]